MNIKKTAVKGALAVAATVAALTTNVSAKDFSGAELYTLQEVQYGKFEARMKMAAASGTVSSMFLYQNGSEIADGRPWVEVDIEVLGKNPGSFQSNRRPVNSITRSVRRPIRLSIHTVSNGLRIMFVGLSMARKSARRKAARFPH